VSPEVRAYAERMENKVCFIIRHAINEKSYLGRGGWTSKPFARRFNNEDAALALADDGFVERVVVPKLARSE
jgi:hypothetical protein